MSHLAYRSLPSLLLLVSCLVLTLGLSGAAANAAGRDEKPRRQYTVGASMAKKLNAVVESLTAEDYDQARELLEPLSKRTRNNPYERALVYQMLGFVASSGDHYAEALGYFEKSLLENALPEVAQEGLRFNVAQLYVATGQYAKALVALQRWFEDVEKPTGAAYYLLGVSHYELEQIEAAIPAIRKAIALTREPKESWYQLLVGLYFETKAYADAVDPLERLIELNPKKSYWTQLSALYSNVGNEVRSVAIYQLAYEAGLLELDRELRQLAQLYLYHEMPYLSAKLLEKAIEAKQVAGDEDAWELLANSWLLARENEFALPALEQAAKLSEVGDTYARIGQVHLQDESWSDASAALSKALAKGDLKDKASVNLLLGISLYHQQKPAAARKHFMSAKAGAKEEQTTRKSAVQWLAVMDREAES